MNHPYDARRSGGRPQRRRLSRQRYLARRVGVLAVLGLGLFGLVKGAGALTADDGEPAADGTDTTLASASAAVTTTAAPAATTAAPDTAPPSSENPARLLVVGDSDAGTFGPYLEELMDDTGVVESEVDYKVSSGLSRPDFFDWPAHARTKLQEVDPDIVVVTFGGNDAQGMSTPDGEFPGDWSGPVEFKDTWLPEYQMRVSEFMDLLSGDGRTVIWVGIPNDDNPDVTERMAVQDEAVRKALKSHPDVIFVDTWNRFSGLDGNWAEYVIDPRDGEGKDVRAEDGFHLNENGAEILALDIADVIRQDLEARGADI